MMILCVILLMFDISKRKNMENSTEKDLHRKLETLQEEIRRNEVQTKIEAVKFKIRQVSKAKSEIISLDKCDLRDEAFMKICDIHSKLIQEMEALFYEKLDLDRILVAVNKFCNEHDLKYEVKGHTVGTPTGTEEIPTVHVFNSQKKMFDEEFIYKMEETFRVSEFWYEGEPGERKETYTYIISKLK